MPDALIGLGSNQGDRASQLDQATHLLRQHTDVEVSAVSCWHATPPVGGPDNQDEFLNGAVRLQTSLSPRELLELLQRIEHQLGRKRSVRWEARAIDLDLLLYGTVVLDQAELTVPHPFLGVRRFVLAPAAEIAADMLHPLTGWTVAQLLQHLEQAAPYFAMTGPAGVGATRICQLACQRLDAQFIGDPLAETVQRLEHLGSSGLTYDAELELLHDRAEQLGPAGRPEGKRSSISDFWLGESLAFAHLQLTIRQQDRLRRLFPPVQQGTAKAKVLFLLDAPDDWLAGRNAGRFGAAVRFVSAEWLHRLRAALLDQIQEFHAGPLLRLDARQQDRVVSEVTAAIMGMR